MLKKTRWLNISLQQVLLMEHLKILRELRIVTASHFQDKEKTLLKKIKKFLQTRNFYPFTIVS